VAPTVAPTVEPTVAPTVAPTTEPTVTPTVAPTVAPTIAPTLEATVAPIVEPSMVASEAPVAATAVNGTVLLPDGTVLPEDAEWIVEIQDTSIADAAADVVGQAGDVVVDTAATEIPFEIPYEATAILDTRTYTLQARIVDSAGTLLYTNDTSIPVLTGGAGTEDISVPVVAVQPAEVAASMAAEASLAPDAMNSPEASPAL
jgi:uncharacterized lipoprotein YbaY